MPKSIKDLVEMEPVTGLHDDEKMIRKLGGLLKDVKNEIPGANDDAENWNLTDLEHALDEYSNEVDSVVGTYDSRMDTLKILSHDAGELLDALDEVLQFVPYHLVLNCKEIAARNAEEWLSNNATGTYDFVGVKDAAILILSDQADHMLFKIHFGIV